MGKLNLELEIIEDQIQQIHRISCEKLLTNFQVQAFATLVKLKQSIPKEPEKPLEDVEADEFNAEDASNLQNIKLTLA